MIQQLAELTVAADSVDAADLVNAASVDHVNAAADVEEVAAADYTVPSSSSAGGVAAAETAEHVDVGNILHVAAAAAAAGHDAVAAVPSSSDNADVAAVETAERVDAEDDAAAAVESNFHEQDGEDGATDQHWEDIPEDKGCARNEAHGGEDDSEDYYAQQDDGADCVQQDGAETAEDFAWVAVSPAAVLWHHLHHHLRRHIHHLDSSIQRLDLGTPCYPFVPFQFLKPSSPSHPILAFPPQHYLMLTLLLLHLQ